MIRISLRVLMAAAAAACVSMNALAASGSFDPTFGAGTGFVTIPEQTQSEGVFKAAAATPDGGIVVAGGSEAGLFFRRYTPTGVLDPTFGTNGTTFVPDFTTVVRNVYLQNGIGVPVDHLLRYPDGHFVFESYGKLTRLSANGVVDSGFRPTINVQGTGQSNRPYFLFPRADGGIIYLGAQQGLPFTATHKISIRLFNADGSSDTAHGGQYGEVLVDPMGISGTTVTAASLQPDGKVLVGGFVDNGSAASNRSLFVVRVDQNGVLDTGFAQGGVLVFQSNVGFGQVSQIAVDASDGRIAVAHDLGFAPKMLVLTPSGSRINTLDVVVDANNAQHAAQALSLSGDRIAGVMSVGLSAGLQTRQSIWIGSVSGTVAARLLPLDLTDPSKPPPYWALEEAVAFPADGFWLYGFRARFDISVSSVIYQLTNSTLLRIEVPDNGTSAVITQAPGLALGGLLAAQFDRVIPLTGEKSLALEREEAPGTANRTMLLRRFNADGSLDMGYGGGTGKFVLPVVAPSVGTAGTYLLRSPDGDAYAALHTVPCFENDCSNFISITKVRSDGTVDASFASAGTFQESKPSIPTCYTQPNPSPALTPDGKILFIGYPATQGDCSVQLKRLLASGQFDSSFGTSGAITILPNSNGNAIAQFVVHPDGRVTFLILDLFRTSTVRLQRIRADGQPDTTFGIGGIVTIDDLPVLNGGRPSVAVVALSDGSVVLEAAFRDINATSPYDTDERNSFQHWLIKYRADGQRDQAFGAQGIVKLHAPRLDAATGMRLQPDGKLLVAYRSTRLPSDTTTVTRLNANGTFDTTFTSDGNSDSTVNVDGTGNVALDIALTDEGRILLAGYNGKTPLLVRLNGQVEPQVQVVSVVEFYNMTLGHYFMTADAAEAAAIDAGAAGPGWQRTGLSFVAWIAPGSALTGGVPVCRFYGTPGRGPNSHFYTANAAECASIKRDPGWTYEGTAFYVIPPVSDQCPGSAAVYRAYNNGFARNDSNHRYSTQLSLLQAMTAQGWSVEGVAFCS